MSRTFRFRLLASLALIVVTVAFVSHQDRPAVSPANTYGSYLFLNPQRETARQNTPLPSIPTLSPSPETASRPEIRIPVHSSDALRVYHDDAASRELPPFELPDDTDG